MSHKEWDEEDGSEEKDGGSQTFITTVTLQLIYSGGPKAQGILYAGFNHRLA